MGFKISFLIVRGYEYVLTMCFHCCFKSKYGLKLLFFSLKQTNLIFQRLEVTKILAVEATRRVCLFMWLDHDFESF